MKKLYILFFLLLFSFSAFSQDGLQERAKKLSDEMTVVLSLDDETSEKIYHIQLKRFIDAQKIRKVHQNPRNSANICRISEIHFAHLVDLEKCCKMSI